jgi:hypothetical protein
MRRVAYAESNRIKGKSVNCTIGQVVNKAPDDAS